MKASLSCDIAVIGTGPAGLASALALTRPGLVVALVGPPVVAGDTRTAALFDGSVTLLENLELGALFRSVGEPIYGIRIIDDMGSFLRAPEVTFTAAEAGKERFGYNVPINALTAAMRARADACAGILIVEGTVSEISANADHVAVRLVNGETLSARLVVGADGRHSLCRQAAGIDARRWGYEQSALTCTFSHQRPHRGISSEFHRPCGPFTAVPSPGNTSSLVWVERPEEANRLLGLSEAELGEAIELRLQGLLGSVGEIGARGVFPLSGLSASRAGQARIALVGEAVHVIPPIGAQGLNLGLRDVACLADCVSDALAIGGDIGAPGVLDAYDRMRRTDIAARIWSIDLLNRSLLSSAPPVQALRTVGLHALNSFGPLRRRAIREGLSPSFISPRLMQPSLDGAIGTP